MPPYLPIRALNRSQAVRIGKQRILPTTTSYIDLGNANVRKELASHTAIGAVIPVGGLTNTNATYAVVTGGIVTAGTGLTVNVSAGEFRNNADGSYVAGASGTNVALTVADGTNPRIDLVTWNATTGVVTIVTGTPAASPVVPATPAGRVPLAKLTVAASATAPSAITDVRSRP